MPVEDFDNSCISHLGINGYKEDIYIKTRERLLSESTKLSLPLKEELFLLDQLTQFELGRFLLQNKGLDGYWIDYIISGDHSNVPKDSLEYWILNHAPIVTATKERFKIFQMETQKRLVSNMKLVSIPCGAMKDLLLLDYSQVHNISLNGIDLEIELAQKNVNMDNNLGSFSATIFKEDAWKINEDNKYDLIISNGLNIYEPSEDRLIELYSRFYRILSPQGTLITSFITKAPSFDANSPWKNFDAGDLVKQKALFSDIIQTKWQNSITESQMLYQLNQAGFIDVEIIYDSKGMFPTVIARS